MYASHTDQETSIYTVSRLNSEVKNILEGQFPFVWVEGEISNFAAPNSGHWYFALKDATAQVRCAMFRGSQRKLQFVPKDGMHVLLKARVSLYENRGEFQIIAEDMEERGEGKLRRAFEALQKKLAASGLFADAHKKSLPPFPKSIGVITSATGAAIRDILTVLKRRHACLPVIIYPTLVQGEQAAPNIVQAIQTANRRKECDVLILARGGGSLEDLWAFNEEIVAQAIFQSELPIISGVGHEVDFTIADFVADVRAPTPSAAAEIVTRDGEELLLLLKQQHQRIMQITRARARSMKQQLAWMAKHLYQQHPKRKLLEQAQRLDFYELNLRKLLDMRFHQLQTRCQQLQSALRQQLPTRRIQILQQQLNRWHEKLQSAAHFKLERQRASIGKLAAQLDALSPLAILGRGFAIASKDGLILRDSQTVELGDKIEVRLEESQLTCEVLAKESV